MPDIASSDVTYTLVKRTIGESGLENLIFKIDFGNGVLTYPAGGVPLLPARLGCPNEIVSLSIYGSVNGFLYKYDAVNRKVMVFQGDNANASAAPGVQLAGGVATPAAASLYVEVVGW